MIKELVERWQRSRLSPLGLELWDSFGEPDWHYPDLLYGTDSQRTHIEHNRTKLRVALNYKHATLTVYYERGPAMDFTLKKVEQKILLKRYKECTNKMIAFQFQIAPFKGENQYV